MKSPRQLANDIANNRVFKLNDNEMNFVRDLLNRKQGLQIFRTNQKELLGDFLVIDKSNSEAHLGFLLDLKMGGGGAGNQLGNRDLIKKLFGLDDVKTMSGTADELLAWLSQGRAAFN